MGKRYRRPKIETGQIIVQRGKDDDGEVDMVIFYGDDVPRSDRALIYSALGAERITWDNKRDTSLIDELEARGYDIETFKFSIKRKKDNNDV